MLIFSLSGGFLFIFILSYFRWQNFFFRFYPLQEVSFSGFIPFRNYPVQKLFYSEWILVRNYPYQELFYSDWILFQEPSFSGIIHYRKCPVQDFVYAENILLFFFVKHAGNYQIVHKEFNWRRQCRGVTHKFVCQGIFRVIEVTDQT